MALCTANTSIVFIDVGSGIDCVKAAITRPLSFRMMQPILARFFSSKTCINALSIGGWESSSFGHIVKDINFFASAFRGLSFSHTRRLGNKVAHRLTRSACKFPQFHAWMEDIPPDIASVYFFDLP